MLYGVRLAPDCLVRLSRACTLVRDHPLSLSLYSTLYYRTLLATPPTKLPTYSRPSNTGSAKQTPLRPLKLASSPLSPHQPRPDLSIGFVSVLKLTSISSPPDGNPSLSTLEPGPSTRFAASTTASPPLELNYPLCLFPHPNRFPRWLHRGYLSLRV